MKGVNHDDTESITYQELISYEYKTTSIYSALAE